MGPNIINKHSRPYAFRCLLRSFQCNMFQTGIVVITTSTALRRGSTGAVAQLCAKFVKDLTYVHLINENTLSDLQGGIYAPNNHAAATDSTYSVRFPCLPPSSTLRRFITDFYTRTANLSELLDLY